MGGHLSSVVAGSIFNILGRAARCGNLIHYFRQADEGGRQRLDNKSRRQTWNNGRI